MRKMTKTAAVLAAMSAMTVASASMAFAATDNTSYSTVAKEAKAAGEALGEWNGDNVNGWTFTPAEGTKLKGTWAKINDAWYYFQKDGIMAQNELVYLEGETYYFDSEGRMMANGWVGFDYDSDVLYDYDLDVTENVDDIVNSVFANPEDAYDTVWMYFNADGTAKDDEWYQAESGLWYRFDDIIMVCGDFDHEVDNKVYGFDENGAMLVGWNQNYVDKGKSAPNDSSKTWYYYNTDGKKFEADVNGYGWKKIDGDWYCFYAQGSSVGTLVVNAFFTNSTATNGNSDYYYVDKNGVMATGVATVDGGAKYVDGTNYSWTGTTTTVKKLSEDAASVEVYFDSNGKAKADAWNGDSFYAGAGSADIFAYDASALAVSGYTSKNSTFKGALVKSSFVYNSDKYYYVDKYGDKVVNSAVEVGKYNSSTSVFTPAVAATSSTSECKAYVLAGSNGVVYEAGDIATGRTVRIGSKKYIATGNDVNGMQVFYYNNNN